MSLNELSHDDLHDLREKAEQTVTPVVNAAVRAFLRDTYRVATTQGVLTAAGDPLTLGQMYGWWAAYVDADVTAEIRRVWQTIYQDTRDGVITATSLDGLDTYMANVTDRLVQGLTPPLPEAAFDRVRLTVTQAGAEGWSKKQTANRLAAELGWETDGPYWRSQLADVDAQIDGILDPLGPPGNPVREAARLADPRVLALREQRNRFINLIDDEKSYWQNRASRIATTETTGAFNYGHLSALHDEDVEFKEWIATRDQRTRPTHLAADGQIVPIDEPFIVGVSSMQMPGDPSGGASETIRCRCVVTGADTPVEMITNAPDVPTGNVTSNDVESFNEQWAAETNTDPDFTGTLPPPGEQIGKLFGGVGPAPIHVHTDRGDFVVKSPRTGAIGAEREAAGGAVARALGFDVTAEVTEVPFYYYGKFEQMNTAVTMGHVGDLDGFDWYRAYVGVKGFVDAEGRKRLFSYHAEMPQSFRMSVLDMVTGNTDRGSGNWRVGHGPGGVDDNPVIYPIDHENIDLDRDYANFKELREHVWGDFVDWWFPTGKFNYALPTADELSAAVAELGTIRRQIENLRSDYVTAAQKTRMLKRLSMIEGWFDSVDNAGGLEAWLDRYGIEN